jgi:SAM-dependent methyltransferase
VTKGIVESFDLYEISDARIEDGERRICAGGLTERVRFHKASALEEGQLSTEYDLVYWNNALHHMFDAERAVSWSRERLQQGGLFFMDDFVGPTRFQWTNRNLSYASCVRRSLPRNYLINPHDPTTVLRVEMKRPDPIRLAAADPTEAADSASILPAIQKHFPDARVILTGGAIYHLALADVLAHFDENNALDRALLTSLLLLDEALTALGENHYALAYAYK